MTADLTPIIITAIICATLIALCWISKRGKGDPK